jgi:hypothetical protein
MTLNQTPPDELRIFSKRHHINPDGSQMSMRLDPNLQAAIANRWQDIVREHPGLIASDDGVGILVRNLFEQLQAKSMKRSIEIARLTYVLLRANLSEEALEEYWRAFLLRSNSNDEYIERYWLSFLLSIALEVTRRVSRATGLRFSDVRCACIGSIGNLYRFYRTYNNTDPDRQLLSNLKAYASRKIQQSSYGDLRLQFNDDTIGRSNLGLITRYKSKIEEALRWVRIDSSTNQILDEDIINRNDEDIINRNVALCKTTIEYLRAENRNLTIKIGINRLNSSQFDQIGQLYCTNTSRTRYLQEINQGRTKQDKLTLNNLSQQDLDYIALLCSQLNEKLPPSIRQELDITGGFVRQFVQRFKPVPIEGGTDNEKPDFIDTIESGGTPQENIIENVDLQNIIQSEISSYYRHLVERDRKILYLRDSFNLGQDCIAHIILIDQGGVCRRLSQINKDIKKNVIKEIGINNQGFDAKSILSMVIGILNSDSELETRDRVNTSYYDRLSLLIDAYKEYFEYLKIARRQYPNLAMILQDIKQRQGYAQQFEHLAGLSPEQYPKLRPELNMASFLALIEKIQNILEEKVQNSSDELWN